MVWFFFSLLCGDSHIYRRFGKPQGSIVLMQGDKSSTLHTHHDILHALAYKEVGGRGCVSVLRPKLREGEKHGTKLNKKHAWT